MSIKSSIVLIKREIKGFEIMDKDELCEMYSYVSGMIYALREVGKLTDDEADELFYEAFDKYDYYVSRIES